MSRDTDRSSNAAKDVIDIWGSCVSRDTLEFMPTYSLGAYVARQSAIVGLAPATDLPVPLDALESLFQRRMLAGDKEANASFRLEKSDGVCVLVDLVDERTGVWQFPDGTYLTNSVEALRAGVNDWGPGLGGRLIAFGTDEHFFLWKQGFTVILRRIMRTGKPVILLDVAWAEVFEGQTPPKGIRSYVSGIGRRSFRYASHLLRTMRRAESIKGGIACLAAAPSSPGDMHVRIARRANEEYRRYIEEAAKLVDAVVHRGSADVRMNMSHKWGIGPYHYSDPDYEWLGNKLHERLSER